MLRPDEPPPSDVLNALRVTFGARAAGSWRVLDHRLEQMAFSPADDLPDEVARGFAEATTSVPLTQTGLGIVDAANTGETVVSLAAERPPDSGSGHWLRRFGASRSVAVPIVGPSGAVARVVALALDAPTPDAATLADAIRRAFAT